MPLLEAVGWEMGAGAVASNASGGIIAEFVSPSHYAAMPRHLILTLCFSLIALISHWPADAVCAGETMTEEFRNAKVVVRARLVSKLEAWSDEPSERYRVRWGDGGPVVLYELRVLEVFKGYPGAHINFFEERNSGAFYLDVDRDYLLFLDPIPDYPDQPTASRNAMFVRYSCGQSKPWDEVKASDLAELRRLSAAR